MEEFKKNLDENDLDALLKSLINTSLENFQEERELSLDRYRRQDDSMESPEDFILQGKFAVDYLKVAADRSNAIMNIAKMIKDIVYKDSGAEGGGASGGGNLNDAAKREIFKYLQTGKSNSNDKTE